MAGFRLIIARFLCVSIDMTLDSKLLVVVEVLALVGENDTVVTEMSDVELSWSVMIAVLHVLADVDVDTPAVSDGVDAGDADAIFVAGPVPSPLLTEDLGPIGVVGSVVAVDKPPGG